MLKIGTIIGIIITMLMFAKFVVFGQSPTPRQTTPTPTVTVPGGAPATGMAGN